MSFLELAVFLGVVFVFYRLFRPLQRRLEKRLYHFFRKKTPREDHIVIDITESLREGKSSEKRKL